MTQNNKHLRPSTERQYELELDTSSNNAEDSVYEVREMSLVEFKAACIKYKYIQYITLDKNGDPIDIVVAGTWK